MLVLRPADAAETTVAWKMAMENTTSPTGLILSRQNVTDIPAMNGDRYTEALQMEKGGYVVLDDENPDVVLVGNGSEVGTLYGASQLLKEEGIKCRIVSMPSIGLFKRQSAEYRKSVIPADKPIFGLTAGLPSVLFTVVGVNGKVYGLDHFGASAPYTVLDEKFGYNAPNIAAEVKKFIGK